MKGVLALAVVLALFAVSNAATYRKLYQEISNLFKKILKYIKLCLQ